MKNLVVEYIKIIGYTITGLIFGLSFFLLFVNFYHFKEVGNTYSKSDSDLEIVQEVEDSVNKINQNISAFDLNTYQGVEDDYSMASVKTKLQSCSSQLKNEEIIKILEKDRVNIKDVYELQQLFQIEIVNECLVKQLYDLTVTDDNQTIKINSLDDFAPFFKDNIDQFLNSTDYVQNSIKNNSSYSFSSDSSKLNIFDNTKDSYYYVVGNYRKAMDFVLDVSSWYDKVLRGEL